MASKRQLQYARMVQKELADVFQKEGKSLFGNAFITVSGVEMSPDLALAKVHLSLLMVKDKQAFIAEVGAQTKTLRLALSTRIGKQVRIIPELVFLLDDTVEYAMKMERIFKNLDIPPAEESATD